MTLKTELKTDTLYYRMIIVSHQITEIICPEGQSFNIQNGPLMAL